MCLLYPDVVALVPCYNTYNINSTGSVSTSLYNLGCATSSWKNGSAWYRSYPGRANDFNATRLSVSMSSIKASVCNQSDMRLRPCPRNRRTSGDVIKFGADVAKNDDLHMVAIEVAAEWVHNVDFLRQGMSIDGNKTQSNGHTADNFLFL